MVRDVPAGSGVSGPGARDGPRSGRATKKKGHAEREKTGANEKTSARRSHPLDVKQTNRRHDPSTTQHNTPHNAVSPVKYTLFDGFAHLSSGLSCGLAGLAAGMAIGIVVSRGVGRRRPFFGFGFGFGFGRENGRPPRRNARPAPPPRSRIAAQIRTNPRREETTDTYTRTN